MQEIFIPTLPAKACCFVAILLRSIGITLTLTLTSFRE